MDIKLINIKIGDIVNGFVDKDEEGVVGFDGKLNIRPKYQREFIYSESQQIAVINTINNNFPLNVMYWVYNQKGDFELLDGQQRTLSFCKYCNGEFAVKHQFFHNLTEGEKKKILNYKVMVYVCKGDDLEKLEWFKTINIAGERLTNQELRNAIYTGTWLTDAKSMFSKTKCPAYDLAKDYMKGSPIRQDYLETVLKWKSDGDIETYMAINQNKKNAKELWLYFSEVINWVKTLFPDYKKEMKGIDWGFLYNEFSDDKSLLSKDYSEEIEKLMDDDDVTKKSGIYPYIITRNEKYLNIRSFTNSQKRKKYKEQNGICVKCQNHFELEEMEADHITPWSEGGKTILDNCQMLCKKCNRQKSNK